MINHYLRDASQELNEDTKIINSETMSYLCSLPWPGNVRQLENFCRWITVMASGREVMLEDLPPELRSTESQPSVGDDWEKTLATWSSRKLAQLEPGEEGLLTEAIPKFERIMIQTALKQTGGRKRDASILLGWGRNTLTRKINELGLKNESLSD